MKKILIMCLIALGMMFTSCNNSETNYDDLITEEIYSPYNMFDSIIDLDVNRGRDGKGHVSCEIFQTLHEKEGLAKMWSYDVVYVVSETPIFDGMDITETDTKRFKIIGTYTYYTLEDKRKVVPVIMLLDVN